MAEYTISFNDKSESKAGWSSFYSYIPDYMVNMNNEFYTFKDGQIYLHNKPDGIRNNFYGQQYNTEIEFVSNEGPSDVKIFKTIEIEGDSKEWDVTVATDIESGHVNKADFENKEGFKYSYIRRNASDEVNTELLSVQGVGNLVSSSSNVYTFSSVPGNISIGDVLYSSIGGSYTKIGTITSKTSTLITVDSELSTPSSGDFMFVAKNSVAESYGLKGYYASIRLVNSGTNPIEIFAVNTEVSKSFP
jgi:hypothetical protein